jgi:hypothetical protein
MKKTSEKLLQFFNFPTTLADLAIATGGDLEKALAGVSPQQWKLAFLAALLDPEGIRRTESTREVPSSVHTAIHLLSKINFLFAGQLISPEAALEGKRFQQTMRNLERLMIEQEWRLTEGKRFSLEQAVNPDTCPWCKYKTAGNLKKFLKACGFPFGHFDGEPYITQAAYGKALEADRRRNRQLDRERKRAAKKKNRRGKSWPTSGKKRPTSGKNWRPPGKLQATSATD